MRDAERALAAWREHDAAHALHAHDRKAVSAVDAPRALVLEHLGGDGAAGSPRDLFSACARLGRLLAEAGASPSFAVSTIDGAAAALDHVGLRWEGARLSPARASVAEGYLAAIRDDERTRAQSAWEYPDCAVPISETTVAVIAGFPTGDGAEGVADWAARVALGISRAGFTSAIVTGGDGAKAELGQALGLVGVAMSEGTSASGIRRGRLRRRRPAWLERFASLLKRS